MVELRILVVIFGVIGFLNRGCMIKVFLEKRELNFFIWLFF